MDDADRFSYLVRKIVGKRLTDAEGRGNRNGSTLLMGVFSVGQRRRLELRFGTSLSRISIGTFAVVGVSPLNLLVRYGKYSIHKIGEGREFDAVFAHMPTSYRSIGVAKFGNSPSP